jgi:hypothetical protein
MPGTAIESSWVEGSVCTVDEDCLAAVIRWVCRIALLQGVVGGPVGQLSKSPPINRLVVPREIQGVPLLYSKREVGVSGPCDLMEVVLVELSCGATLLHTGVVRNPFRTLQGADKRNPRQSGHDPPYTKAVSDERVNLTKQALRRALLCMAEGRTRESNRSRQHCEVAANGQPSSRTDPWYHRPSTAPNTRLIRSPDSS